MSLIQKILKKIFKKLFASKLLLPIFIFLTISLLSSIFFFRLELLDNEKITNFFDAIWWSIVTMSTTGYGDIVPSTLIGRIVAIVSIASGILATSLFTGTIASLYLNQISRYRSGLMSYTKTRGHIVICGWKNDMEQLLLRIIQREKISIEKIIVIADPEQEIANRVFETEGLKEFKFVRGPFYDKSVLVKANIAYARKALVLADQTGVRSDFEVDSRTVMTVLSIKAINKNIHVSAQLLAQNFEIYLQRAQCDEILFSKVINTELIALVLQEDGISNVISALMGAGEEECNFHIYPLKNDFFEKTYKELQEHYITNFPNSLLLGILENTGAQYEIVEQAIRQAQKTADFPKMLDNLRNVKKIVHNKPVLIPQMDYIIPKYSSAIILERKHAR